jgi:hypothetical protein
MNEMNREHRVDIVAALTAGAAQKAISHPLTEA